MDELSNASETYVSPKKASDESFNMKKLFSDLGTSSKNKYDARKEKINLVTHYACTQSWYNRLSTFKKLRFMKQLLLRLKGHNSLGIILNAINICCTKSTVYSEIQPTTNFAYDKLLRDNNRSINLKQLEKTEESELEWFEFLAEPEQALIIIGLLRRTGAHFAHEVFKFGEQLHYRVKTEEQPIIEDDNLKTLLESQPKLNESEFNLRIVQSIPNLIGISSLIRNQENNKSNQNKTRSLNVTYLEEEDPKNPFSIEVKKRKKIWDDLIRKYRIKVEGKPKKNKPPKKGKKGKNKKGKDKKKNKKEKDKKSKKKEKSKGKGEGKKKGKKKRKKKGIGKDDCVCDRVQLLPFWIVLKIFSYLDSKTLKKVKKVDKYWEFATKEFKKNQKSRKSIDKIINQIEKNVGPLEEDEKPLKIFKRVDEGRLPKKRLLDLSERGAAMIQLQKQINKKQTKLCLLSDAFKQMHEYYVIEVGNMNVFPRDINVELNENVPKIPSCIINELGFKQLQISDFEVDNNSLSIDEICNFDAPSDLPSNVQNFFEIMSTYNFD